MLTRLVLLRDRLHSGDDGISLSELLVVSLVVSITSAIIFGALSTMFSNVGYQFSLGEAEQQTRPVLRELIVRLRQSDKVGTSNSLHPVGEIDWDTLVFYADSPPTAVWPDRPVLDEYRYELVNCAIVGGEQVCDLQLTITPPDDPDPAVTPKVYTGPGNSNIVLTQVLADDYGARGPLFKGIDWIPPVPGADPVRTEIASCAGPSCTFPLVEIDLSVDPSLVTENPRIFEIHEEVRLRNG